MTQTIQDDEIWRRRAEEYRTMAKRAPAAEVRDDFMQLASNCERIAAQKTRLSELLTDPPPPRRQPPPR